MGAWSNSIKGIFSEIQTIQKDWIVGTSGSLTFNDNIKEYFGTAQVYNINSDGTSFFIIKGITHLLTFDGSNFLTYKPFLPSTSSVNNLSLGGSANEFLSLYLGDGANSGLYIGQGQENRIWYDAVALRLRFDVSSITNWRSNSGNGSVINFSPNGVQNLYTSLIAFFRTDFINDAINYENLTVLGTGSSGYYGITNGYGIISVAGGLGTVRDVIFGTYAGSTLTEYFRVDTINSKVTFSKPVTGASYVVHIPLENFIVQTNSSGTCAIINVGSTTSTAIPYWKIGAADSIILNTVLTPPNDSNFTHFKIHVLGLTASGTNYAFRLAYSISGAAIISPSVPSLTTTKSYQSITQVSITITDTLRLILADGSGTIENHIFGILLEWLP